MIRKIDHNRMERSERGWLTCWFLFPFAEYAGPDTPRSAACRFSTTS